MLNELSPDQKAPFVQAVIDRGIAMLREGRLNESDLLLATVAAEPGVKAYVQRMRGLIAINLGRKELAWQLLQDAVDANPAEADAHAGLALLKIELKLYPQAAASYAVALASYTGVNLSAAHWHCGLGRALAGSGLPDLAIDCLQDALAADPHHSDAKAGLDALLADGIAAPAGAEGDSLAPTYANAAPPDPVLCDALFVDAMRHHGAGNVARAKKIFQRVLSLNPDHINSLCNLGALERNLGNGADALRLLERAVALDPKLVPARLALADAVFASGRTHDAVTLYGELLRTEPNNDAVHAGLAMALRASGDLDRALLHFQRAVSLNQNQSPRLYEALGTALGELGNLQGAEICLQQAIAADPELLGARRTLLSVLQYKPGVTKAELLREHVRWAKLFRPGPPRDRFTFDNDPDPERKPRLGVLSADMRHHAVTFVTLCAFEELVRLGYEIVCYQTNRMQEGDRFSDRYKAIARAWRDVSRLDDAPVATQMDEDGVDILLDLSGHTAGNRLSLIAQRAAPIQLSWAGYAGTVGLDTYEGIIADTVEIPPEDDHYYVEPVIRLPDCCLCYEPPKDAPEVGALPSAGGRPFTYGCFNRPAKINEEVAKAWARILRQIPDARLLMVYGGLERGTTQEPLRAALVRGGVPLDRVELIGQAEHAKIVAAYAQVDLALDPFPYSGCVTTLDAMWMGVPTVTLVGETFAGRQSASHLTAAGLRELCTNDPEAYVTAAVLWSRQRDELAELRRGMRARVQASPLCDAPRFARNLSGELMRVWGEWCAGRRERLAG